MYADLLLIRKIIASFAVPPGVFLVFLLLAVFFLRRNRDRAAFFFLYMLFGVVYIMSSWFGEYLLVRPLEDDYLPLSDKEIATLIKDEVNTSIVVLSGGMVVGSPAREKAGAEIGEVTLKRLYEGYLLYQKTGFEIVVSGGRVPDRESDPIMAGVMEKILLSWGVEEAKISAEGDSRTTEENAQYTLKLLRENNYERVLLVTSAVHMRRSIMSFNGEGIDVIPVPTDFLYERKTPGLLDLLPNRDSLISCLRGIHEWVGLLYYSFL